MTKKRPWLANVAVVNVPEHGDELVITEWNLVKINRLVKFSMDL